MTSNGEDVKAKHRERTREIRIRFFTDKIAEPEGHIKPKHCSAAGFVIIPKNASTLAGVLTALAVLLLVACSQTTPEETPDIQATVDAAVTQALSDAPVAGTTIPGEGAPQPTDDPSLQAVPGPQGATPGQPTTQATDDPNLRDISQSQHEQLDELITELMENPQILTTCANEAGDVVPAPGSPGEADWYAGAAIRYSACAASKATGVDFTGGN